MKENAEKFRALDPAELDKQLRDGAGKYSGCVPDVDGPDDGAKVRVLRQRARILTVLAQRRRPSAAAAVRCRS
jgi:ribosomal protein L29